jgi:hypothetical protein
MAAPASGQAHPGVVPDMSNAFLHLTCEGKERDLINTLIYWRWLPDKRTMECPNGRCRQVRLQLINQARQLDKVIWKCYACSYKYSIRSGSIPLIEKHARIPLRKLVRYYGFYFLYEMKGYLAASQLDLDKNTITSLRKDMIRYLYCYMIMIYVSTPKLTGTVEIDEMQLMFRTAPLIEVQDFEVVQEEKDVEAKNQALANRGEVGDLQVDNRIVMKKKDPVRVRNRVVNFQWVLGMICRETKEIRFELTDHTKADMIPKIMKHVELGSIIYTDAAMQYNDLYMDYSHGFINKSREGFTTVKVSTQRIENVWRQFRRNFRRLECVKRRKDIPFVLREIEWKIKYNGQLEAALVHTMTNRYAVELFKASDAEDLWEQIAVPQISLSEKLSLEKMRLEGETDEQLRKRLKIRGKGNRKVSRRVKLSVGAPKKRRKVKE